MTRAAAIADRAAAEADSRPLASAVSRPGFDYRGYRELIAAWTALPGARTQEIGRSVGGEPIVAVEIGPRAAARATVVLSALHPLEWIGVEAAFAVAERLAAATPIDRRTVFVPVVNVDGYLGVEAALRSGRRPWRRGNARGVDLNRNWPTSFRRRRGLLGLGRSGPAPLSEPEVRAVADHVDAVAASARLDRALSLHAIGEVVLMPYGGRWTRPAAAARLEAAARAIANRLPGYRVHQVSRWVPGALARGMEIDHLHEHYGALALLVECTWGGASWRRPWTFLDPFTVFNPIPGRGQAMRVATALEPFVRGRDPL